MISKNFLPSFIIGTCTGLHMFVYDVQIYRNLYFHYNPTNFGAICDDIAPCIDRYDIQYVLIEEILWQQNGAINEEKMDIGLMVIGVDLKFLTWTLHWYSNIRRTWVGRERFQEVRFECFPTHFRHGFSWILMIMVTFYPWNGKMNGLLT